MVLLWRARFDLNPEMKDGRPTSYLLFHSPLWHNMETDTGENERRNHPLKFLCLPYHGRCFWFEVFECARRLLLSSMLVFFGGYGSVSSVVVATVVCLGCIKMYGYYRPFVEDSDNIVAELVQWQLVSCVDSFVLS